MVKFSVYLNGHVFVMIYANSFFKCLCTPEKKNALPSENVSSNLRKIDEFRFIPRMLKVSSGHLLSIDAFNSVQLILLLAYSEGPDQTAQMRRLIWAFAVRICPMTRFRMARLI